MNQKDITNENENDIILEVIQGNKKSEEILYNKYKSFIWNYIKNKYPYNNDINDDVSDIIIKIFDRIEQYDSEKSKFSTWISTITKNHMIDKWRCSINSPHNTFNQISLDSVGDNDKINYDEQYYTTTLLHKNYQYGVSFTDNFESIDTLKHLSKQISSTDYTLLEMKYLQGYDYKEIGEEFNLTSTTVSNRVNYIKTKLKNKNTI